MCTCVLCVRLINANLTTPTLTFHIYNSFHKTFKYTEGQIATPFRSQLAEKTQMAGIYALYHAAGVLHHQEMREVCQTTPSQWDASQTIKDKQFRYLLKHAWQGCLKDSIRQEILP